MALGSILHSVFFAEFIYVGFCIAFAYWNYRRMDIRNKHISHFGNAGLHLVFWILGLWITNWNWHLLVALPFVGKFTFDTALVKFRGYDLAYVSPSPKSILDKIELWLFDNPAIAKVIYLTVIIATNIWYVTKH